MKTNIMDQNIFIFVLIIILIIIFLMSNCEKNKQIDSFENIDQSILEINEIYLRINNDTYNYENNIFNIIVLGNKIVDYNLNKNDILQLQMELGDGSYENIYLKIKSKVHNYTSYTELECESIYDLNNKIMNNINVFYNEKENKDYYKFKLFKIGNIDDNCILDNNIKIVKENDLYKIKFKISGDNDSLKKKYFEKFKVDDIITIIDTTLPFQNPNKNKFLIKELKEDNYDIILQNNKNLENLVETINKNKEKKQILLVRLDISKIIQEHYTQLKFPLGELSYYNFEIKNLLKKVENIKQNVKRYIQNKKE